MKIGFAGCSHSTNSYGLPWSTHMKNDLLCETIDVSSPGASNEMFIEKVKKILEIENNIDFFIIQLTDPSRMMIGLYGNNPQEEYEKHNNVEYRPSNINCYRQTNGISYYNLLINGGKDLNKILDTNFSTDILDFLQEHVLISDYNMKIKIFHTLMTYKSLFDYFGKKVLFFSWNVDIKQLAKENGYGDIIKEFDIIDGCVVNFTKEKKLTPCDSTHYDTESHKIIYNEFIKSNINDFIKKYNII